MSLPFRPFLIFSGLLALGFSAPAQLVRQANTTLTLPADLASAYELENALGFLTFTAPVCVTAPPGETNRLFVVERGVQGNGQGATGSGTEFICQDLANAGSKPSQIVLVTDLGTTPAKQAVPFLKLQDVPVIGAAPALVTANVSGLFQRSECGLLSMAFHPNYNTNGYFFVFYSLARNVGTVAVPNWKLFQRISRFKAAGAAPFSAATTALPGSEVPLITQYDEKGNHNGGDMAFGPDGYLYVSLGDEGNFFGHYANGIYINKDFFSAILRLDVDNVTATATSALPNPHAQNAGGTNPFPSAVHAGTYTIPAHTVDLARRNPFIGFTSWHGQTIAANTVRTEFFAAGMRNPYRMAFDPVTGRLFCGDVGERRREEIDLIVKGGDYGWWWREGTIPQEDPTLANHAPFDNPPNSGSSPAINSPTKPLPFTPTGTSAGNPAPYDVPTYNYTGYTYNTYTDPIHEYPHLGKYGDFKNCIIGGEVMRGTGLPELYGKYLFADYVTGEIYALTEGAGVWTRQTLMTGYPNITDFGRDPRNGNPLLVDHSAGTVNRIIPGPNASPQTAPPALLSQTGAFSNLPFTSNTPATNAAIALLPNTGLVAYQPNVTFWSDYAVKQRWFGIKNTTDRIGFNADAAWTFPTGTVWVKHFDLDLVRSPAGTRRKLETRFLVKTANNVYGLSYKWRVDQKDADLVAEGGLTEAVASTNPAQTWRYPSRAECRTCHTAQGGFALSFHTRQMNLSNTFGLQTLNQIAALSTAGYFTSPVATHNLPALAAAGDTTKSYEARVRSYLAANCVQCHQPGGAAQGNWDARPTTATDNAGLINGPLLNPGDSPLNRFLVPGNTTLSMLLKRIQGNGVQRMPPLATAERDLMAEQLVIDWINSSELAARRTFSEWQTFHFGSPADPDAPAAADPDGDGQRNELEFLGKTNPLNPLDRWTLTPVLTGGNFQLSFPQTANRGLLIETSTDLQSWSLWNVPGNAPGFSATTQPRILTGPVDNVRRFFRAQIFAQ